jgi:hypothetical protein
VIQIFIGSFIAQYFAKKVLDDDAQLISKADHLALAIDEEIEIAQIHPDVEQQDESTTLDNSASEARQPDQVLV